MIPEKNITGGGQTDEQMIKRKGRARSLFAHPYKLYYQFIIGICFKSWWTNKNSSSSNSCKRPQGMVIALFAIKMK